MSIRGKTGKHLPEEIPLSKVTNEEMKKVYIDGKEHTSNEVNPAKHTFIGMYRLPDPTSLFKEDILCSCYTPLRTHEGIVNHWLLGHLDIPKYRTDVIGIEDIGIGENKGIAGEKGIQFGVAQENIDCGHVVAIEYDNKLGCIVRLAKPNIDYPQGTNGND